MSNKQKIIERLSRIEDPRIRAEIRLSKHSKIRLIQGEESPIVKSTKTIIKNYDVFICYNSKEKVIIRRIYNSLKNKGFTPWFDEECLIPGDEWLFIIDNLINSKRIKSAAVFLGTDGIGPWGKKEIYGLLTKFYKDNFPIIPVLLPGSDIGKINLPIFLQLRHHVDFNEGYKIGMKKLIAGIDR